ncbi:hypothetical protein CU254_35945 [Amycolatopsis sp. AA4]|uniref:hypothetical protein n=1 Tax=Actinomycetes TaxID=1760 RepID=UPI0001B56BCA|nr:MULTISPECIES: hypothetical protein [Actinomycetes]ATY15194.1 hypothetical protein CU254_35945 [Amycolatopsis sp. AA4]EFL11415.1 predicted protein [Streptomyces sp. AA4]
MSAQILPLNHRERATLTAVGLGRAEMTCSCEPDLYIDGVPCCDQFTAHRLARFALVVPLRAGRPGERVPALLTAAGRAAIGAPVAEFPQSAA